MNLRTIIVDDEPLACTRLRRLLADCQSPAAHVLAEAGNAADAMTRLQHEPFDLMLLDIHMPGADGLRLAKMIADMPNTPLVVFVTAHPEHAVQAFELEAIDYLTKPVRLDRLQSALQKVERALAAQPANPGASDAHVLLVRQHNAIVRLPVSEVLFFKAEQKYVCAQTAQDSHWLDDSLNQLEARFGHAFIRIHRNALVAREAIVALIRQEEPDGSERWVVQLRAVDELLAVSRRQLSAVRATLDR